MNSEHLSGFVTLLICGFGYFFAWKNFQKNNIQVAVLLLIFCGLFLRVYISLDMYLHFWDERYHALVAKNLMNHPFLPTLYDQPILPYDYTSWSTNHVWLHKQPMALWGIALSFKLFGINEIALRLPSIILTTLGIGLTYKIGKYFFDKKIGFLAAFLYSINGLIIEMVGGRVSTDHIDILFLFFIELAVFLSIQFASTKSFFWNVFAGIAIGFAVLSKYLPGLIVLPIWLLIVWDSGKFSIKEIIIHFVILCVISFGVFVPWQIYIHQAFPLEANWESSYNFKHLWHALEGHDHPFYFFLETMSVNYGELIYIPLIWFLYQTFKLKKDFKKWAIAIWFLIPFVFFTIAQTKMQAYILFSSPALFMMTAAFWFMLWKYKTGKKPQWIYNLILLLLIALPLRYTVERMDILREKTRNPVWVKSLKKLNEKQIQNGILLNFAKPVEAMFYTDLTVYHTIPDKNTIEDLLQKNYTILINDDGNIPASIKMIKGIQFLKIASE